jgi:hypothetical protein
MLNKDEKDRRKGLVKAVKEHAKEHYDEDGWKAVVDAWSDDQILGYLLGASDFDNMTQRGAVDEFANGVAGVVVEEST